MREKPEKGFFGVTMEDEEGESSMAVEFRGKIALLLLLLMRLNLELGIRTENWAKLGEIAAVAAPNAMETNTQIQTLSNFAALCDCVCNCCGLLFEKDDNKLLPLL